MGLKTKNDAAQFANPCLQTVNLSFEHFGIVCVKRLRWFSSSQAFAGNDCIGTIRLCVVGAAPPGVVT